MTHFQTTLFQLRDYLLIGPLKVAAIKLADASKLSLLDVFTTAKLSGGNYCDNVVLYSSTDSIDSLIATIESVDIKQKIVRGERQLLTIICNMDVTFQLVTALKTIPPRSIMIITIGGEVTAPGLCAVLEHNPELNGFSVIKCKPHPLLTNSYFI